MVDGQLEGCGGDTPGVLGAVGLATVLVRFHRNSGLSHSHKGAAGMRSVLTFEKVVWIVDARVER
jgi:hypothetical protein